MDGIFDVIAQNEISDNAANDELVVGVLVKEGKAKFYYQEKGAERKIIVQDVDITNLSTKKAKGFVGSVIGMYATTFGL
ncbi:MAG: hypothetical protein Q8907_10730 [Bacteroidota bacterium]|nr:hypothetical protein [Bacteroidota bacterium]